MFARVIESVDNKMRKKKEATNEILLRNVVCRCLLLAFPCCWVGWVDVREVELSESVN